MMVFCKECKYFKEGWFHDYCNIPSNRDMVNGKLIKSKMAECKRMRNYGTCTILGKHFEPKKVIDHRLEDQVKNGY